MKRLSLLRHAKSSWDDPVERDFDRPLNGRGHRAAQRMGKYLREKGLRFDRSIASPALRIRQTIEGLEGTMGDRLHPDWDRRIYMASAATLFEIVQETDDSVGHLLLIGHNPGLEDLVLLATRDESDGLRQEVEQKYPTATLATLDYDCDTWRGVSEDRPGRLVCFVRPRDLDPALGPDD
jgi:phosphohistidine phosphatase